MKLRSIVLFFVCWNISFSQKMLDLDYFTLFGKEKSFQFFLNRDFTYRLKDQILFHTKTISNMNDSLMAFTDGKIIHINKIKGIKIKGGNFSQYLFGAGALFPLLDVTNNVAFDRRPILNERAFKVGGIFIAAGLVVNYIQDKHIHIGKNTTLRVLDPDFEHLNATK